MACEVVEAVGGLQARAYLVVVAADERRGAERADAIDHRVRIRAVADEIAEHERMVVVAGRVQHGLERLEIGVNVADDEILQNPIHSRMRSTISATGRLASTRMCAWLYAAPRRA